MLAMTTWSSTLIRARSMITSFIVLMLISHDVMMIITVITIITTITTIAIFTIISIIIIVIIIL